MTQPPVDFIAYLRTQRAASGLIALPEPTNVFGETYTHLPEISIQHELRLLNLQHEPDRGEALFRELWEAIFGAGAYDRMLAAGMTKTDRFDLTLWIMRDYLPLEESAEKNADAPAA